jgi:hypothetical protein
MISGYFLEQQNSKLQKEQRPKVHSPDKIFYI